MTRKERSNPTCTRGAGACDGRDRTESERKTTCTGHGAPHGPSGPPGPGRLRVHGCAGLRVPRPLAVIACGGGDKQ